ncbi:MAG TPA: DUF459 domain-containing protein [Pseudolabrys sp.]|nr:DUF459 domain-containing protein [Pseudolabrys sp.]
MAGIERWWRRLCAVTLVVAAAGFAVPVFTVATSGPALAQWYGPSQYPRRQYQDRESGFFGGLFGGWGGQRREPVRRYHPRPEVQHHVDYSRAPPPHQPEAQPDPSKPVTSIVVMGGSMADWLAYGLEDAFSDSPNVEIVRKDEPHSGLIRYKYKSDLDWWHVAREELAKTKANYVVMMLGALDRQNIRESDVAQDTPDADQTKSGAAKAGDQSKDEPKTKPAKNGVIPFRSDQWARVYSHRIDETIAALKSKGVPVFWVGLPSIRGAKSTADVVYLNNLYRTRAERAGIVYIDVWDGFVDDSGKYSSYGPDYEGQTRQLRSPDGVFFTKYGARKLAHYVEREIRRYMTNRVTTLTLPSGRIGPDNGNGQSALRPLAGPVLPLTEPVGNADVLLGGQGMRPAHADAVASRVLVKGDALQPPPGRADDFKWPQDNQDYGTPPPKPLKPAQTTTSVPAPAVPAAASTTPPQQAPQQAAAPAAGKSGKSDAGAPANAKAEAKAKAAEDAKAKSEEEARAKAEAEAKKRADERARVEARRRAAERARAEAQRRHEWLRPPARVENRPPPRRTDDPFGGLFGGLLSR